MVEALITNFAIKTAYSEPEDTSEQLAFFERAVRQVQGA